MFGTYRTVLALLVVLLHLGGLPVIGSYAVFGFYILSGYLMTLIMHKNYGYTKTGFVKYALNRFLRIYPIYWVSCILTIILILWLGDNAVANYKSAMQIPGDLKSIIKNVLLIFPSLGGERLTPPAWALTVELFYYACIGLGLSKSKFITIFWFSASIVYTVTVNLKGMPWDYKYFIIPAASLPFSTGALIFHYRDKLSDCIDRYFGFSYTPYLFFLALLINWKIGLELGTLRGLSFYINYTLCAIILISLSGRSSLPFISKKFDKLMGDFSYPIYLIHYQVGLVVMACLSWVGYGVERPDMMLAIISVPVILIFAWFVSRYMEQPVEAIRQKIKYA